MISWIVFFTICYFVYQYSQKIIAAKQKNKSQKKATKPKAPKTIQQTQRRRRKQQRQQQWLMRQPIDDKLTEFVIQNTANNNQGLDDDEPSLPPINAADERDELTAFELIFSSNHHRVTSPSKNPQKAVFKQPGETVAIAGYTITGGLFYCGGQISHGETEASLVDETLTIKPNSYSYQDESLGYWPSFDGISAACRGAYIDWLAGPRDQPDTPIGYLFLYFYGFERRILIDHQRHPLTTEEYFNIYHELVRLRATYHHSRSFNNYSTRLIEYMAVIEPTLIAIPLEDIQAHPDSLLLRYTLATTVAAGAALPPQLAFKWLLASRLYQLLTPARRCAPEFNQLFADAYFKKYPQGLIIKPNKTRFKISFHSASASLFNLPDKQLDLPDPMVLVAPLKHLIKLADDCTTALEPYSRYLGRKDNQRDDIAGLILLPDSLISISKVSALAQLASRFETAIATQQGLLPLADIFTTTNQALPPKINKKEQELILSLCDKLAIGIAPDPRYHQSKLNIDESIVVFNLGHEANFTPTDTFNDILTTLRLGAMVATIDGQINPHETTILSQLIDNNRELSATEKRSLHAYLIWRLHTPVNMTGLKARLQTLDPHNKSVISHMLVAIALADGTIDHSELQQLEKLYAALGLDKSMVATDIHRISTDRGQHAAQLNKAATATAQAPVTGQSQPAADFLNHAILAIHEAETKSVQQLLGGIFTEDETKNNHDTQPDDNHDTAAPLTGSTPSAPDIDQNGSQYDGLDPSHSALFTLLLTSERWPNSAFNLHCEQLGLMPSGAIEVINDWAYELIATPILEEDDDTIILERDIIEELNQIIEGTL